MANISVKRVDETRLDTNGARLGIGYPGNLYEIVVKAGDTFQGIALHLGVSPSRLYRQNGGNRELKEGERLVYFRPIISKGGLELIF